MLNIQHFISRLHVSTEVLVISSFPSFLSPCLLACFPLFLHLFIFSYFSQKYLLWGISHHRISYSSVLKGLERIFYFRFSLFLEKGKGREKGRVRNTYVRENHQLFASLRTPPGKWTCNPSICPDRESNQWPSTVQGDSQPNEPHWAGPREYFIHSSSSLLRSPYARRKSHAVNGFPLPLG